MSGRWVTPAIGLILGGLLFAASAIGGEPLLGAAMFAVMAIWVAILLVLGGRSETIGVLAGRPADERLSMYSIHATAVAGIAAILVALAGFLWATARGESGSDFGIVVATAGVAYLAALAWFRWRG